MPKAEPDLCSEPSVVRASGPSSSHGTYLYCFARRAVAGRIKTPGLDDHAEVATLAVGEVAAVISSVSLEAFTGPLGDANLSDVSWVVPRARRHEEVVEAVMSLSPVLPARFGTVFSSPLILERLMASSAEQIGQFLERMDGREEWSVSAFLDTPRVEAWLAAAQAGLDEEAGLDHVSPGVRYLNAKRLCVQVRRQLADWSRQRAEEVEQLLAANAEDVRRLRLGWYGPLAGQPKAASGDSSQPNTRVVRASPPVTHPVLNCALLVVKDRVAELRERALEIEARYADRGLSLRVSGPWPPYSFCPSVLDAEQSGGGEQTSGLSDFE